MRLITKEDFIDIYQKLRQRGSSFLLSKLNTDATARTKSAFSDSAFTSSNWWIIPKVKSRWNLLITGDEEINYEAHTVNKHLVNKHGLRMLSIGSGMCSHEIEFAQYTNFSEVVCMDIADNLLAKAEKIALDKGLNNMSFWAENLYEIEIEAKSFDVILFHASLHHFSNIEDLVGNRLKNWLKDDGYLIINEFVGADRLQFSKDQLRSINQSLSILPDRLKKRYKTEIVKKSYSGSGYLRMIVADPSECIESSKILPAIHQHYQVIEEKSYGGNLLMNVLKDISHHFVDPDDKEAQSYLDILFIQEDEYLKSHASDFVYGVYTKK